MACSGRDKAAEGDVCAHSPFLRPLFLGSSVGVCWVVCSGCGFSSSIKKKLDLFFSFLFMERTEGGCTVSGGGVWGGG